MNIILFDGCCNLCSSTVLFLLKRDKHALFRFAALQSEAGQALLRHYAVASQGNRTIYYIRGNECFQQSTAILSILKDLGGIWSGFYPLILLPACIRDALYLFISRHRYRWFGKRERCRMPAPELKDRFLE